MIVFAILAAGMLLFSVDHILYEDVIVWRGLDPNESYTLADLINHFEGDVETAKEFDKKLLDYRMEQFFGAMLEHKYGENPRACDVIVGESPIVRR